eukprot:TRINITY_DN2284_c0_g1_i1.p1 TRINITY_DN2284_c0_g1~~TRINITY_DN2284_c0_g1_i1.p1  ORF type:complete len:422 (+),score=30.24 TRINITY_DN2284_c0_g1_i1:440-1705(+)
MEGTTAWDTFTTRLKEIGREVQVKRRDGPRTRRIQARPERRREFVESEDEECNTDLALSLDSILPDDLLERIFSYLPIASVFRARTVCKRWHSITDSRKFMWQRSQVPSQKPWYFMFTNSDDPSGLAYDPALRKWYSFSLPCINTSSWFVASSSGLVCFMDNTNRNRIFVCNPVTKCQKSLPDAPELRTAEYSALAITVDKNTNRYLVTVAKSKQIPDEYFQYNLSIEVYDSAKRQWMSSPGMPLRGWRGGDEGVICHGVFFILIYSIISVGNPENRHRLIMYDLSTSKLEILPVPMPCSLTCGRLMNLRERLVMVGGIGKVDRPDIIKGIGIWELDEGQWREVGRMPHKYFQGFGEFDEVFSSSGTEDLIYIQSYGAPALLVFDKSQRTWRWSQKCPVNKRFPLQLFTGFCFEPRLEVDA